MMTRKDYRIIADSIVELYYDESSAFESTQHAAIAQYTIAQPLRKSYHNFDITKWNEYIERKISPLKESK